MSLSTRVVRNFFDPVDSVQREFDALSRLFSGRGGNTDDGYALYGVDIREDGDQLFVEVELPGFRKEDINITLENQTLTIAAERYVSPKQDKSVNGEAESSAQYLLRERRHARFLRSFTLPPTIDEKRVDAKLSEGVLCITLYKREETKPRKIQVG